MPPCATVCVGMCGEVRAHSGRTPARGRSEAHRDGDISSLSLCSLCVLFYFSQRIVVYFFREVVHNIIGNFSCSERGARPPAAPVAKKRPQRNARSARHGERGRPMLDVVHPATPEMLIYHFNSDTLRP